MKRLIDMDEPELRHVCNVLAQRVEDGATILGVEKPRFVLLLFNDPAIGQYVSNCDRRTMIEALRETVERLERKEDVTR